MDSDSKARRRNYRGQKLNYFTWRVSEDGYDWSKAGLIGPIDKEKESWFLTDGVPIGSPKKMYEYVPAAGLFRHFATLETNKTALKDFAKQHGALTNGDPIRVGDSVVIGERLEFWKASILAMKDLVGIWLTLTQKQSGGDLQKIIHWRDEGVTYQLNYKGGVIAARKINPELFQRFAPGDVTGPAWHLLQSELNEHLQRVSARMLWNHARTKLTLYQVPQDLMSEMWLQFARAVDGDREYAKCEGCHNWFEIASPDGGRRDKQFCGSACRARHWRKQREASK
jgi:hypothetical protein